MQSQIVDSFAHALTNHVLRPEKGARPLLWASPVGKSVRLLVRTRIDRPSNGHGVPPRDWGEWLVLDPESCTAGVDTG
jgi:hypothetical protein